MAKKKEEAYPGYDELRAALQSGGPANVYIFFGEETYLMQQAVEQEQFITMNMPDFLIHGRGMEH